VESKGRELKLTWLLFILLGTDVSTQHNNKKTKAAWNQQKTLRYNMQEDMKPQ